MISWILILYFSGAALIFCEVFLPGGVLGVLGAVIMVASCILGVYAYPEYWYAVLSAQIGGGVLLGIFMAWWFPRSPMGKNLILRTNLERDTGYTSDVSNTDLVGKKVEVVTALRPVGTIEYKGKRVSAVADGEFIDAGETVRVLEVHGNRVVVERAVETDGLSSPA